VSENNSTNSLTERISRNAALSEEIPEQVRWWEIRSPDSKYPEYLNCIYRFFVEYLKWIQEQKVLVKLINADDSERILLLDYNTRFSSTYKKKLKRKLSKIVFKRCTHLTITTDLNQYSDIISATKGLNSRWNILLVWLKRELDKFHKIREDFESGKISEDEYKEYLDECPFDLRFGIPPKSDELKWLRVLEFSLGDEDGKKKKVRQLTLEDTLCVVIGKKEGHGSPHLHILLENLFFNVIGVRKIREVLGVHCKMIKLWRYFNTKAVGYVLKYVKKAIVLNETRDGKRYFTNDNKKVVHASLYWITGCHMFSMSRTLQKEIREKEKEEKNEKKKWKGKFVATIPKELREKPYPYRDDCPDSIEGVLDRWFSGESVWLKKVVKDDFKYWSSRIRHVWDMLVSEWKSG